MSPCVRRRRAVPRRGPRSNIPTRSCEGCRPGDLAGHPYCQLTRADSSRRRNAGSTCEMANLLTCKRTAAVAQQRTPCTGRTRNWATAACSSPAPCLLYLRACRDSKRSDARRLHRSPLAGCFVNTRAAPRAVEARTTQGSLRREPLASGTQTAAPSTTLRHNGGRGMYGRRAWAVPERVLHTVTRRDSRLGPRPDHHRSPASSAAPSRRLGRGFW